jgi:HPt (histidine-containing phosphotransfer) domain-containing protein
MFELDKMVDRWITYSRSMYDLLDDTLFNREQLLDQVVGDEEKYQRLISVFIKDTTKYLEMLKELITKQNLNEALAVARLLGSVSDDVTARVMTRTARQIEQAAKTENFAQLSILIRKLEEQFERTRGAIY